MPAHCKCINGHVWTARLIEDDPDTNCTTVEPDICPECESENFEIQDIFDDGSEFGLEE